MAVAVAYDMYLEVAEGTLINDWKLDDLMDFWRFREKLANSMLQHKPMHRNTWVTKEQEHEHNKANNKGRQVKKGNQDNQGETARG